MNIYNLFVCVRKSFLSRIGYHVLLCGLVISSVMAFAMKRKEPSFERDDHTIAKKQKRKGIKRTPCFFDLKVLADAAETCKKLTFSRMQKEQLHYIFVETIFNVVEVFQEVTLENATQG